MKLIQARESERCLLPKDPQARKFGQEYYDMYLEVPNNYYELLLGKASAQMIPGLLVGPQRLDLVKFWIQ